MGYRYDLTVPLRYDEMFANSFKLMSQLSSINKDTPVANSMAIFRAKFYSSLVL